MLKRVNLGDRPAPTTQFVQGTLVPAGYNYLHTSGQVGELPDGSIAPAFREQVTIAWKNLLKLLRDSGFEAQDIIKTTVYLTNAADVSAYRSARDAAIPGLSVASTLVVVSALASPEFLVEVEAIAAKSRT